MQYVTEEVARDIERAVEVITTDEQGFLREAALEYIRDNAPQDKVEGARYIRIVDGNSPAGVIGILTYDDGTRAPKFTPEGKTQSSWWELERCRRISNLTAPEKPEEKPEPVKLYCVKEYKPGEWLTRGKVYEFVDGGTPRTQIMHYDAHKVDCGGLETRKIAGEKLTDLVYPLVSRPAKVGEWVLLTEEPLVNEADHCGGSFAVDYHKGDLVKITHFGTMPSVRTKIGGQYSGFRDHEYLVLDGYDGRYEEQEQPKPNAALTDRIIRLKNENRLLEAENAKLCAKIAAIRKAVESEG